MVVVDLFSGTVLDLNDYLEAGNLSQLYIYSIGNAVPRYFVE